MRFYVGGETFYLFGWHTLCVFDTVKPLELEYGKTCSVAGRVVDSFGPT